jgi:hypothetical protein
MLWDLNEVRKYRLLQVRHLVVAVMREAITHQHFCSFLRVAGSFLGAEDLLGGREILRQEEGRAHHHWIHLRLSQRHQRQLESSISSPFFVFKRPKLKSHFKIFVLRLPGFYRVQMDPD